MLRMHAFLCILLGVALVYGESCYPTSLVTSSGTTTEQPIGVLATIDDSSMGYSWDTLISFSAVNSIYSGIFTFKVGNEPSKITTMSLLVNYMGPKIQQMTWQIEIQTTSNTWIKIGDNTNAAGWSSWTLLSFEISQEAKNVISNGEIHLRYSSLSAGDASMLDFVQLRTYTDESQSGSPGLTFQLKYLVISLDPKASGMDFASLLFNAVGSQYDLIGVTSTTDMSKYLCSCSSGKYAGIISVGDLSLLTATQKQQILDYQDRFLVRWVVLGSSANLSAKTRTNKAGTIKISETFSKYSASMSPSYNAPSGGAYYTGVNITDSKIATSAVQISSSGTLSSIVVEIRQGTSLQLHFLIALDVNKFFSMTLTPLVLDWIAPGRIFEGTRRLYFLCQPDDLYSASFLYDPVMHKNPLWLNLTYRLTPADITQASDFLTNLNSRLPPGSTVNIEWPFNGLGVINAGGYDKDPLFLKTKELRSKFLFLSHTYSHFCTLDTASFDFVDAELKKNVVTAQKLFDNDLTSPCFSNHSLVNPCITGLFNGEALRALQANGIIYVVGDNSVPALVPPNRYHGTYLPQYRRTGTMEYSLSTELQQKDIDYDVSTIDEFVDSYNRMMNTNKTFEQAMASEIGKAVDNLLQFIHWPYMFHQANVRSFTYNGKKTSHLQYFMEGVATWVARYYNIPIQTVTQDALAKLYIRRMTENYAKPTTTLKVENGCIVSMSILSKSTCTLSLSGIELSGVPCERAGPEVTSFVPLTPDSTSTFTLPSPIPLL